MNTAAAEPTAGSHRTAPLGRRWFAGTVAAAFLLTFLQTPGLTVADTKYDLAQNPLGFLRRAAHLWSSQAPMGQVQNQAYGYFFPHGAFFALGHTLGLPAWIMQRIWWALLILAGFWGVIRLCEVLGIGTRGSRIVAALAFALAPRVLTTIGSISSETLPMMLAPWVLLAPAALGRITQVRRRIRRSSGDTDPPGEPGGPDTGRPGHRRWATVVRKSRSWLWREHRNRRNAPPRSGAHSLPTPAVGTPAGAAPPVRQEGSADRPDGADATAARGPNTRMTGSTGIERSAAHRAQGVAVADDRVGLSGAPADLTSYGLPRHGALSAAGSALALALMGSVNAVATAAAFLPAAIWWASYRPNRAWWRFTRAWIPLLALGTLWWVVPLLVLGKVSPPFLDYIESSGVTTQWASLGEVLRGTDSWTPFVSPERIAGAVLVTQPGAVLATGLLAAAGMAGLAMRSMPGRGRFTLILIIGLVGICAGYAGELGGPFAEPVRAFLDAGGAPLRNVHKLEPLIRLPLVIGLAQLLGRVPLPGSAPMPVWRRAFAHPERDPMVALAALVLAALALSTSLAWTSKLAPRGAYDRVPAYWTQTAQWLASNAADTRALVVPGAPFGSQIWGLTRDEPLQALATTPWAVRDAVPLTPPGAIRAMDSVQRLIADGRPSAGLAPTLIGQGIGILVLRNDLDPDTSRSTRPMLAHEAIERSPGLTKVAQFGSRIITGHGKGLVADGDLRPAYPAVEIYRVEAPWPGTPADIHSGLGAPASFPGAYTVPLDSVPVVQGGPEVLERLRSSPALPNSPVLLATDAARAGLSGGTTLITDTPMDRETDFGKVDDHSSALRAPTDARRTFNRAPDYAVPGTPLVEGRWSGATITASSSAADATQLGGTAPGSSTAAVVDGDPSTAWLSNSAEHAVGQWLRLDLAHPIRAGVLQVTTSAAALGDPVKWIEVRTANGTVAARIPKLGGPVAVSLPPGRTGWLTITATATEGGTAGGQFGISAVALDDYSNRDAPVPVDIRHRTVLPPVPAGTRVRGWDLGQEFPGRAACFDAPDRVRCDNGLALSAEEPGTFQRTLSVPGPMDIAPQLIVRARQSPELEALLTDHNLPVARGSADVGDLRGSAFAVTDSDPRTSWIATQDTVRNPAGPKPTLTLELPAPTLVTGLDITPPTGALPARPTSVSVNLGDGPQVRTLDPDAPAGRPIRITLHPRLTDRIELSIATWNTVLDRTALGFAQQQPPGLAEVRVLGPDYPAPAPDDRPITIDCAHGPTIAVGGRIVHTTITATADQLRSSAPVPAQVCGIDTIGPDATGPSVAKSVDLPDGQVDVTVTPTPMFSVNELRLNRTDVAAQPVSAPPGTRLLVLPLSTNVGWRAHTADGHTLTPTVADGWEQAWLVPTGAQGPITVEFPIDRWYRLSIFGGLLLLLPLIALVLPRFRRRRAVDRPLNPAAEQASPATEPDTASPTTEPDAPADPAPRTWNSRVPGAIGLTLATFLIAGPVAIGLTAAGLVADRYFGRRSPRILVAVAGIGTALAMAALSTGPWRSPDGYMGGSLWVQFPALVSIVALGISALPRPTRATDR
ncbi:arabinofuranan 3-O-arabinosyltransferase [Nocardia sp. GAS34]|uniref:alpha-(1->3)-arabinofuranosyltransferase domain-containing protein n=1 Tax=unclassified Nocardia TaxID=2637762 RepID=UPI003D19EE32